MGTCIHINDTESSAHLSIRAFKIWKTLLEFPKFSMTTVFLPSNLRNTVIDPCAKTRKEWTLDCAQELPKTIVKVSKEQLFLKWFSFRTVSYVGIREISENAECFSRGHWYLKTDDNATPLGLRSKTPLEGYSVFLSNESSMCKTEIQHPRVRFSNVSQKMANLHREVSISMAKC